jgi:hypothetical protein
LLFQPGFGAHQSAATPNRRFMATEQFKKEQVAPLPSALPLVVPLRPLPTHGGHGTLPSHDPIRSADSRFGRSHSHVRR